ncbi:hypothetical protein Cgig2_029338 [Carnegiea gigantea]|uniref:BED-type domain-containing protein n=1 Tax=Carnegiea gigantea TaxID=171969 RepID=A0A9Q1KW88_9CARY|nr:hypothetical protein Cgig2_029338 [Carnegiea gigantea]
MSGHSSRSTEDVGWHFGTAVDGNKKQVWCKFCGKIIKGGITRLKQHLTHKTGDVASCPEVSAEVKRDMNKLLQEFKEKKKDNVRRTRDLEQEIARSINRIDVDEEDDEDDDQLAFARYQSLQQHQLHHDQQVFRASRGRFYDEGGSSQATQALMRRSATVQEDGSGKGVMAFTPLSTPAERLKAVKIDLEKGRTRTKQSKVNSSWMTTAKKKLMKAFGRYYFNPEYMYREHEQAPNEAEIRAGVQRVIIRQGQDTFGTPLAQRAAKNTMPDQQSQGTHNSGSGGDLSPPSTADGSGDGGNGGNQGVNATGTSQSSRPSLRDINPTMSDHNSRRGEEYKEETIAHTYRRLRKAKDKASKPSIDYDNQVAHGCPAEQQTPSTFTAPVNCNWSCGSNSYDAGPYNYGYDQINADWGTLFDQSYPFYPGSEPHLPQSNPSSQTHDNFQVFNHGTINYGDYHYYRPTIHAGDLSSSGQSWMDATSSYFFQQQGTDTGYTEHQNEETNYQESARRSFWW